MNCILLPKLNQRNLKFSSSYKVLIDLQGLLGGIFRGTYSAQCPAWHYDSLISAGPKATSSLLVLNFSAARSTTTARRRSPATVQHHGHRRQSSRRTSNPIEQIKSPESSGSRDIRPRISTKLAHAPNSIHGAVNPQIKRTATPIHGEMGARGDEDGQVSSPRVGGRRRSGERLDLWADPAAPPILSSVAAVGDAGAVAVVGADDGGEEKRGGGGPVTLSGTAAETRREGRRRTRSARIRSGSSRLPSPPDPTSLGPRSIRRRARSV